MELLPAIQARIFELGGAQGNSAVSFSVSAFNVGIVAGASLGGVALELSGLTAVSVLALALGVLACLASVAVARRRVEAPLPASVTPIASHQLPGCLPAQTTA